MHWEYEVIFSGLNYRLSDINCALGISQLKRLKKFIKYRESIARIYIKFFSKISNLVTIPYNFNKNFSSWHLFIISINFEKLNCNKVDFIKFLLKKKIITQFHYIPIYKFKVFNQKIKRKQITGAENYYRNSVSLPIYFGLPKKKIGYILKNIEIFFK
jgi:dTDP-4-amino-4,6-dideoxygalactose transaminase